MPAGQLDKPKRGDLLALFEQSAQAARRVVDRVVFPVPGGIVAGGGPSPGHRALDIPARTGTPVYAARGGRIALTSGDPAYGLLVRVQQEREGIEQLYAHLSRIPGGITSGREVRAGELIGYVGSSGQSSGPHLHFEVNPIGPERFSGTRSDLAALDPVAFLRGASMPPRGVTGLSTGQPDRIVLVGPNANGRPKSTTAAKSGAVSAQGATMVKAAPALERAKASGLQMPGDQPIVKGTGVLGGITGPTYSEVGRFTKRIAFWSLGGALVVLGLLLLAYSFREEVADIGLKAGSAAAGNPAPIVTKAVGG